MARLVRLRNSFFLLFNGVLLISCEQDILPVDVNASDKALIKDKGVFFYNETPLNGRIIELFENGDTAVVADYEEGIKSGVTRKFWESGNLKFEAHYKNGIYHGAVAEWYEDGTPFTLFNYKEGRESGRQQAWKPDGSVKANYEVIGDRKYGLTGIKNCSNVWED